VSTFFISFAIATFLTLFLIKQARRHGTALDSDLMSVQKVHATAVPRIGGLAIFFAVVFGAMAASWRSPSLARSMLLLLICSSIALIGGLIEDYTQRVSPLRRLVFTLCAAAMGYFLLDARIDRIDWLFSQWSLHYLWIALPLTLLAVAGIANAINIIDGFNGLAGVVTICMLFSLCYVALQVNDVFILVAALLVAGATAGFLVWNYPVGFIFLGDGGAYFLGFMLGELSVMLVMRNPQVSTWYAALLLIYPVFETLFSIYRRLFLRGKSPGLPDGIHLHSLIFRRVVLWAVGNDGSALTRRNALTSPYLWLLSLLAVIPATVFWRHTGILMAFCAMFVFVYVWLYARIVRFRSPRWLILGRRR
jgi:UDP-N-acetylmuramyl pentapeptide phosphotransferase/UDP-N-acetylglucosamine-1-phosphate transferase